MADTSRFDAQAVAALLASLPNPVKLVFFTQSIGCEMCLPARQVLDDLVALGRNLSIEELNVVLDKERAAACGVDRAPAIALETDHDTGIRFLGAPLGYEAASLVEAIRIASGGDSELTDESRALVAEVTEPIQIQVFTTPSCSYCPRAVSLAHRMAIENPMITAVCVEATEFPDLVSRYRVTGVPKTVVLSAAGDVRAEIMGALPEADFVRQIVKAVTGVAT
jgi:glutaredoxin-like protein